MTTNFIAGAPEPSRSSATITLAWGLLNIPLSMYAGTEDTSLGRKEFVDGDSNRPAGRAIVDKTTGEVIDSSRVVRMAETSNGSFVELTDDEIAAVTGDKNVAQILCFMPVEDMGNYVPEKLMQVRPKRTKGVPDAAANKAFSLFVAAMTAKRVVALVKLASRGPAKYGFLTSTGDLIFVHSTDGVRSALPLSLLPVDPDHLEVAEKLIEKVGITSGIPLGDQTAQAVRAFVETKAGGGGLQAPSPRTPVQDRSILDELVRSLGESKPASSWGAPSGSPVSL